MGETVRRKQVASDAPAHESPLVPNSTMRRLYQGIVASRMLDKRLRKRYRKARLASTRGQEACRVAALLDLGADDLVSDVPGSVMAAFLRGAEIGQLLEYAEALAAGKKDAVVPVLRAPGLLPAVADPAARLRLALGAALAIKRLNLGGVVVVLTESREVKPSIWKETLEFAALEELPMLFVVLPEDVARAASKPDKKSGGFDLSARASSFGVPGIPVDASDGIALYRVVQESLGRARAGGGPALMECSAFVIEGQRRVKADPILSMGQALLLRKICSEHEIAEVASSFQAELDAR